MDKDWLARLLVQRLTEIFRQLEACDSLYVNQPWERMLETSIEIVEFEDAANDKDG